MAGRSPSALGQMLGVPDAGAQHAFQMFSPQVVRCRGLHDVNRWPFSSSLKNIPTRRQRRKFAEGETRDTCSAAAGTFLVEFGALSRLTGDPSFEAAARRSVAALWDRRSPLGLVGGGVKGSTGQWDSRTASIGAGTDRFGHSNDNGGNIGNWAYFVRSMIENAIYSC